MRENVALAICLCFNVHTIGFLMFVMGVSFKILNYKPAAFDSVYNTTEKLHSTSHLPRL